MYCSNKCFKMILYLSLVSRKRAACLQAIVFLAVIPVPAPSRQVGELEEGRGVDYDIARGMLHLIIIFIIINRNMNQFQQYKWIWINVNYIDINRKLKVRKFRGTNMKSVRLIVIIMVYVKHNEGQMGGGQMKCYILPIDLTPNGICITEWTKRTPI